MRCGSSRKPRARCERSLSRPCSESIHCRVSILPPHAGSPGEGLEELDMLTRVVTGLVSSGLLLTAQAAFADHGNHYGRDRWQEHGSDYAYARVVDVDPIVRHVRISEPRQECWNETRYEDVSYTERVGPRPRANPGAMILGGIIGAAIGNQIGHGDGRRVATVAGAVIGTAIGHDASTRGRGPND